MGCLLRTLFRLNYDLWFVLTRYDLIHVDLLHVWWADPVLKKVFKRQSCHTLIFFRDKLYGRLRLRLQLVADPFKRVAEKVREHLARLVNDTRYATL